VVQTNMRGNHIALVEEGRVPGARVLDGRCFDHLSFNIKSTSEVNAMVRKNKKAMDKAARDSAVEELKALVPQLSAALQTFLEEEGEEEVHQEGNEQTEQNEEGNEPEIVNPEESLRDEEPEMNQEPETSEEEQQEEGEEQALMDLVAKARAILEQLQAAAEGVTDNVEGLQGSSLQGAQVSTDDDDMKGEDDKDEPEAPRKEAPKKAEDAALRRFYADAAAKDSIYKRLSAVVGTFDHRAMDANQVCTYGVKKLGLKCAKGQERFALDAYLTGTERARAEAKKMGVQRKAQDSIASDEINSYLNGGK